MTTSESHREKTVRPPTGRHRRPHRTLAEQIWHLAAAALAIALAYVFVPPRMSRPALDRAPERGRLTSGRPAAQPSLPRRKPRAEVEEPGSCSDPDHALTPDAVGGALVRPYMPPPPPPSPRHPAEGLLAAHGRPQPGEFDELADLIRVYLDPGRAD